MKKILYFILVSVFSFGFVACGGGTDQEVSGEDSTAIDQEEVVEVEQVAAPSLEGSWLKSGDDGNETYTFNADNTLEVDVLTADAESFTRKATWNQGEGTITFKFDDMDVEQVVGFSIDGANLNLIWNQGTANELTQTFVKQ